jgi:hypothetical protein
MHRRRVLLTAYLLGGRGAQQLALCTFANIFDGGEKVRRGAEHCLSISHLSSSPYQTRCYQIFGMFAVQYGMTGCRFLKLLRACGVHILGILDKPMMISGIMTGLLQLLSSML